MIPHDTDIRRINTCMYGQAAFDVLSNLGFGKYGWFVNVRRDIDDMIYFEVSENKILEPRRDSPQNPFVGLDDRRSLLWIASRLKREVAQWAEYQKWKDGWWREKNDEKLGWLTPDTTVSDAYAVHACLSGKKPRSAENVVGSKAAPAVVEKRIADKKELDRLRREYDKKKNAVCAEYQRAELKYQNDLSALWKEYFDKCRAIDPQARFN